MRKCILQLVIVLAIYLIWSIGSKEAETAQSTEIIQHENVVAITFDDGPSSAYTGELLEGLSQRGVVATFFLVGERIPGNEELIKRMQEEGHLVGNHSYSHCQLCGISPENLQTEIEKTNNLIESITGEEVKYLRPPFGIYDKESLSNINMSTVLWTVDTLDWSLLNADKIVEETLKNVESGDIILMHDIYPTSIVAALRIIDELKLRGYVFVTVDELLNE